MDIIIQSLGFTAGDGIENFVREKLNKFDKEANIIRADVTLFIGSDSKPEKYYCEIRLEVAGKDHFAKRIATLLKKLLLMPLIPFTILFEKQKKNK